MTGFCLFRFFLPFFAPPTSLNCAHCHAPLGDISIGIKCAPGVVGPAEADIDFDIIKNDNDTFTVKYTPPAAGRYTIMVMFADQVKMNK